MGLKKYLLKFFFALVVTVVKAQSRKAHIKDIGLGTFDRINIGLNANKGVLSSRKGRDSPGESCPKLDDGPVRHQYALKDDNNINMKIMWIGENFSTQLLLTSFEKRFFIFHMRKQTKLYQSKNDGLTYELIKVAIKNADIRNTFGIVKSETNPLKVILIGYDISISSTPSTLYISQNGAQTWNDVKLPFQLRHDEPIIPHPKKENWLLALEDGRTRGAWLSIDFGLNWKHLRDQAYSVKWGADTGNENDIRTIFITVKHFFAGIFVSPESSLFRSTDLGDTFHLLHDHIYSLGIQGAFLFISVDLDKSNKTRVMHVSKNNGGVFHRVRVPEVTPERFYAILDMSEGQVFLHVDDNGDTGKGNLYVSDDDGIMYTKSLEDHFYTNNVVTDFYKVESMRGVFITHQLMSDKTLKSVITFDRGTTWHPLFLDENQCKGVALKGNAKCSLHYHHTYSQMRGHMVPSPLSTETALGIIMLHGVSGDALHTNNTSVYMSRNGGYNWTKVLDGPHHYAIGDHGNLIVAVPLQNETSITQNVLHYSLDQGRCWNKIKFTDDPIVVKGLVTEPRSRKRTFSLWGILKADEAKDWQVITINFGKTLKRKCQKEDYEYWDVHAIGRKDGCYLGYKEQYPRTKKDAICYSGEDYKPEITTKHCTCTKQDLECEYGYQKDDANNCFRDKNIKLQVCRNGDEEKIIEGKGYRRIPGDKCVGGNEQLVVDAIKYIDTKVPCKDTEIDNYGFTQKDQEMMAPKKSGPRKGLLVFAILMVLVIAAGGTVYFVRKAMLNRNSATTYRYSQLSGKQDDDLIEEVNGYDPRPNGMRPYQDESDIESDSEMLKL